MKRNFVAASLPARAVRKMSRRRPADGNHRREAAIIHIRSGACENLAAKARWRNNSAPPYMVSSPMTQPLAAAEAARHVAFRSCNRYIWRTGATHLSLELDKKNALSDRHSARGGDPYGGDLRLCAGA